MFPIIGRLEEIEKLNSILYSNDSEFIAVYGRRRVGKTYLIRNYFNDRDCIFFHVTGLKKGTLSEQIANFTMEIGRVFYSGAELKPKSSWIDALEQLTRAIELVTADKKIVLFFVVFTSFHGR